MSPSVFIFRCAVLLSLLATALAHTNMFFPNPRTPGKNYVFSKKGQNACENTDTQITDKTKFKRGQSFTPGWFWNNHKGGFIKFALVKGIKGDVDNAPFLDNKNIINGQCYTGGCEQGKKDTGNKFKCEGKPVVIPDHIEDGDYILQFSSIGGFSSNNIPTKLLPIYHNCANIRIEGGNKLIPRPKNWIAPFIGGSQDKINGKSGGDDVCGFKEFNAEPADPSKVDVNKDVRVSNMEFGKPDGWAVAGKTLSAREDNLRLPRMGHVARTSIAVEDARENIQYQVKKDIGHDEIQTRDDDEEVPEEQS